MFKTLNDKISVSPQITVEQVAEAKSMGATLIINNRPDDESPDQTNGAEIEAAARAAGLDYVAIPVTHSGFSAGQLEAMTKALASAEGKVLAYCRSGTRSTLLWALSRAKEGANPMQLSSTAASAGYDLSPIRPMLDGLAAQAE